MTEHGSSAREPDQPGEFGGPALDGHDRGDRAAHVTERSGVLASEPDEPAESAVSDQFPPRSVEAIDATPLGQRFRVSGEGSEG